MKGKVILFIVEGPTDKDAVMPFITEELSRQKIKVTVKIIHGDILTKYIDGIKNFEVTPGNVKGKIKQVVSAYLETPLIQADQIKLKHIHKIYYLTDTDDCFSRIEDHSLNKKNCLSKMFNFGEIEMNRQKKIPFDVIFFSKNLEHIIDNNESDLTDKEKEEIAYKFAVNALSDNNYFVNTFKNSTVKTWETYKKSYNGIKEHKGRACNMNNLLDEIEEWKQ